MKIAIFGKLNQATSYHDWYTCFRRQLREVPISEILITGGNTVLNRYVKHYANEKHQVEELVVEGNKGLLHAVIKYDETKGYKFISYAHYWIKEYIKEYLKNNSN